jgi:hypothetical protein
MSDCRRGNKEENFKEREDFGAATRSYLSTFSKEFCGATHTNFLSEFNAH